MTTILDHLTATPFLRGVPLEDVRRSSKLWQLRTIAEGDILWVQGQIADEIGVLVDGELQADVGGTTVGTVRGGELVGEVATFFREKRSASLLAREPVTLLTLSVEGLRRLRKARSRVYLALLDQALVSVVRRVRSTNLRIAREARGDVERPTRKEPGALARMWRKFMPGGPKGECPPLVPLLRKQPLLDEAPEERLELLASVWEAVPMEEGQIICEEGKQGDEAWLIAEGSVDVLRNVRGDRAERLCTLVAGQQFGVNTLVEKGTRTASCVAASAGWLYRIEARSFRNPPGAVGVIWKESVLASLTAQVRNANRALNTTLARNVASQHKKKLEARVEAEKQRGPGQKDEAGFQALLKASGYLEGLPIDEKGLGKLDFVIDDAQQRMIQSRKQG